MRVCDQILQELYRSTVGESGEDQAQKGTQLLEIYALEIQMHNERKNYKKLKVASLQTPSSPCIIETPVALTGNLQCI